MKEDRKSAEISIVLKAAYEAGKKGEMSFEAFWDNFKRTYDSTNADVFVVDDLSVDEKDWYGQLLLICAPKGNGLYDHIKNIKSINFTTGKYELESVGIYDIPTDWRYKERDKGVILPGWIEDIKAWVKEKQSMNNPWK